MTKRKTRVSTRRVRVKTTERNVETRKTQNSRELRRRTETPKYRTWAKH